MNYTIFIIELARALGKNDGERLAYLLSATGPGAIDLRKDLKETGRLALMKYSGSIASPWDEVGIAHVQVVVKIAEESFVDAYTEQANLVKAFFRAFINSQAWILPALFILLKDLRDLAEKADDMRFQQGQKSESSLEDAARLCNKAFTDCVVDRTSGADSRKWGIYHVVGLIFKCYFSVNRIALSRNIINALRANKDIPPLEQYPLADQVTYRFYLGKLSFMNEQYAEAEKELSVAFTLCHQDATRNMELLLKYLIPLRLMRGILPSKALLHLFPNLGDVYQPFVEALRSGNVKSYDEALEQGEIRLLESGVYLAVEKAREICLRCLFRNVWKILGQPTRVSISHFHEAFRVSGIEAEIEETECILATMIYKGYMKGYISHERQTVVLAKGALAFPKLKDRQV